MLETMQGLLTSSSTPETDLDLSESSMRQLSASFDRMNDDIAQELIEGELDASDSTLLQNRVGKIAGSALNGTAHSVGDATFAIDSGFAADGCQVFIV